MVTTSCIPTAPRASSDRCSIYVQFIIEEMGGIKVILFRLFFRQLSFSCIDFKVGLIDFKVGIKIANIEIKKMFEFFK